MTEILKDCPFCGCRSEVLEYGQESYIVFCRDCRAQTASFLTVEQAENAWNKRVEDAPKIGLSEEYFNSYREDLS